MGALGFVLRADLRHRWRSWIALSVLVALVGGLVLAAMAAGRRTESAFPRFVASRGFDVVVYAVQPIAGLNRLPGVTEVRDSLGPFTGQPTCNCTHPINSTDFGLIGLAPGSRPTYKLISGNIPDPRASDQVLASFTLQEDSGVHIGSVIHVPLYAASQVEAVNNATGAPPTPGGPTVTLKVVGIAASEYEFPSGNTPSYDLYTTPAFQKKLEPKIAVGYVYFVNLRDGAAGVPRFVAQASAASPAGFGGSQSEDALVEAVERAIHPQAVGWWVLAGLSAFVGIAVLGQALFRQSNAESESYPTITALGGSRRLLFGLAMARTLAISLVGGLGAVLVATLLSPIAPLGEARTAEVSTGINFDVPVLTIGALGIVGVVLCLGIWPALRASRTSRTGNRARTSRPSVVVARLAALGAPPSAVVGVRHALESRSGGSSVPVGSAIAGTILAITALCGTVVFGASLSHLTATPKLYGTDFQLNFSDTAGGNGGPNAALLAELRHDRNVTGITEGIAVEVAVNNAAVGAIAATALKGRLPFSTVNGHLPNGDGEIGLGAATMREAHASLGSDVHVTFVLPSGQRRTVAFRVVSTVSLPVLGGVVGLGTGAMFTLKGYEDALCSSEPPQSPCRAAVTSGHDGGVLASITKGPEQAGEVNHYLASYQAIAALPVTPTSLVNFGEAVNFPLIFGGILAVFGIATLVHLLIVSVARRRREIGLLKVLGFVNRQAGATVAWQATTFTGIGVIVGIPLGVIVGEAVWRAFSSNLGAVPVSIVPVSLITVLVAGSVVAGNLIALLPAAAATRSKPQSLLRAQ